MSNLTRDAVQITLVHTLATPSPIVDRVRVPPLPLVLCDSHLQLPGFVTQTGVASDRPGHTYVLVPRDAQSWLRILSGEVSAPGVRDALVAWSETQRQWQVGAQSLSLNSPLVMGIVNVTPDSFSDGGHYLAAESAIAHAIQLVEEGAHVLDIGGESTRPGAAFVGVDEELRRVLSVIRGLQGQVDVPISIDTRKARVAAAAIEAGATIVNDVSAMTHDPEMVGVVADSDVGLVLMHMRGQPANMQDNTQYDDFFGEIVCQLERSLTLAYDAGIDLRRVLVDPGIGFGKKLDQNLDLIAHLDLMWALGRPQLLGASRKRFIGELTGRSADGRVHGTVAAHTAGILAGAAVIRVHDVAAGRDAAIVANAIRHQRNLAL